jgi:hypothetical protein
VAHTAGVAGKIHSRSEPFLHISGKTVTFRKALELKIGKMGGFLHSDNLIRLPLILKHVLLSIAVPKLYPRAVFKPKLLFGA